MTDHVPEKYAAYNLRTTQDARIAAAIEAGLGRAGWSEPEIARAFAWYRDHVNPKAEPADKALSFSYCMERAGIEPGKIEAAFGVHQAIAEQGVEAFAPAETQSDAQTQALAGATAELPAIAQSGERAGLITGPSAAPQEQGE